MKRIDDEKLIKTYIEFHGIRKYLDEKTLSKVMLFRSASGEFLFEQGDVVEYLYLMVKGRIKVSIINENGDSYVLRYMNRFTILGEAEAFSGELAQCSVETLRESDFLRIAVKDITNDCFESPKFLKKIIISLSEKLRTFSSISYINSLYPVKKRLAIYLLSRYENSNCIKIGNIKKEIGDLLGITPRHLNRVISELVLEGILSIDNSEIIISDKDSLKAIAGDERLEF